MPINEDVTSRIRQSFDRGFHRQVALLYCIALPAVLVIDVMSPHQGVAVARWAGFAVLGFWAVRILLSESASAVPLIIGTMFHLGALSFLEAAYGVDVTRFDFATTFGAILLASVLGATLVSANRRAWSVGLASMVAAWVSAIGIATGTPPATTALRVLVSIAGVVFTASLVSGLLERLAEAVEKHDRATRLEDAIANCSEALLVHSDMFAVYEATRSLLDATDADYAYVDRTAQVEGEVGWEIIADASRRGVGWGGGWRRGKYSAIPSTFGALSEGRAVVIRTAELLEPERRFYEEDGIRSEVLVPIFVGREMRGSIGFIQYTADRKWTEDEIQTLWRAAHMIGAYWRRLDDAERLRASNESKDRLLASVSHEIRTPLTAIVGLSEEIVAGRESLGDDEVADLVSIIAHQSRELAELVEDLLVASRADSGNLSIRMEPVDLIDQASQVVEGVRESHPSTKAITLEGDQALAWADPLRVRQIIRNLLTNAIKYGGENIGVQVEEDDGRMRLVVADDGPGVSDHEADLIFERYYRSSQSPTQPGSMGIGLAVSRQLAEMMGGTLDYVSGQRHRFVLTLPADVGVTAGRADAAAAAG